MGGEEELAFFNENSQKSFEIFLDISFHCTCTVHDTFATHYISHVNLSARATTGF